MISGDQIILPHSSVTNRIHHKSLNMQRRNFIRNSVALGAAITSADLLSATPLSDTGKEQYTFKMKYAPHDGMFANLGGKDILDQLRFMADEGFTAFEDNGMTGRDVATQEKMSQIMTRLGISMGVFVAHKIYWNEGNLTSGNPDKRAEFLSDIRNAVEVAKRVNARWITVVPGCVDPRLDAGYQFANVMESLRQASDILMPHGLIMVLEPLNYRDHPNLFLTGAAQGYAVCKAVNSPACKILFDIYHMQIQQGNLIPSIDAAWDEIAYIQIGDNPGRNEPTTGEINYQNIFKHLHEKGFTGILGMEHGNSLPGKEGERAVIDAYKAVDHF
jgi:hydroxypyruvate isomerase